MHGRIYEKVICSFGSYFLDESLANFREIHECFYGFSEEIRARILKGFFREISEEIHNRTFKDCWKTF